MSKSERKFGVIFSVIVVLALIATVFSTIVLVNRRMRAYCFSELSRTGQGLALDLNRAVKQDRMMLTYTGRLLASYDDISNETVLEIVNAFDLEQSYITYLAVMFSDGTVLRQDGSSIAVSGEYGFKAEADAGTRVTGMRRDWFNDSDTVVCHTVPVMKNGEIWAVLYGVISLSDVAREYTTDIYDGKAYVYLVDGATGDFLLDTWHKTLGNMEEFRNRKVLEGYDFDTSIRDMRDGRSGNICFVSTITNLDVYLHYEPTEVNSWNVLVSVDENAAFAEMKTVSRYLYIMAAIIGVLLLLCMIAITIIYLRSYRTIHKIGTEDQVTQLQNRNAFDALVKRCQSVLYPILTCVYIDVNGLHEVNNKYGHQAGDAMLRAVADALKDEFSYRHVYRIGGDEFVALNDAMSYEECVDKVRNVTNRISEQGYAVSVGIRTRKNEVGLNRVIREADEDMLENKRKFYERHDRRGARAQ